MLNREEAHNAMFREAFNKVQKTGSNRDFGTTKAAKMYFSLSEPSPADSGFPKTEVTPPFFPIIAKRQAVSGLSFFRSGLDFLQTAYYNFFEPYSYCRKGVLL